MPALEIPLTALPLLLPHTDSRSTTANEAAVTPPSPSPDSGGGGSSLSGGAIAGIAIAGVAVAAAVLGGYAFYAKNRSKKREGAYPAGKAGEKQGNMYSANPAFDGEAGGLPPPSEGQQRSKVGPGGGVGGPSALVQMGWHCCGQPWARACCLSCPACAVAVLPSCARRHLEDPRRLSPI